MTNRKSAVPEKRSSLRRGDLLVGVFIMLALALPFLDKPIHIDDPVTLRVSANILRDPANPLAGQMDWFGHNLPLWEVTTNPPFLSYWLAPALAWWGDSERALHAFMAPFLLLLALGLRSLSGRFTKRGWLPALFAIATPAVWVSVNLMRDVPAAGLLCAGLALFVAGADRPDRRLLVAGAFLCGLATITKYSALVAFPLLAVHLLLQRRTKLAGWATPALIPMAGWCLLTWFQYGWIHPLYLLSGTHPNRTFPFFDQSLGALAIVGSSLLLAPPLLAAAFRRHRVLFHEAVAAAVVAAVAGGLYRGAAPRPQALLWTLCGAALLWITLRHGLTGLRRIELGGDRDSVFLCLWALGFLGFSVFLAPFQAVRHVLPALAPLTFLAFQFLDSKQVDVVDSVDRVDRGAKALVVWLSMQAGLGAAVNFADTRYAASYRDFALHATEHWTPREGGGVWYVGHWGWKHYADREGFRQLHRDGPLPREGDLLLWPERVHIGDAFNGWKGYRDQLELVETREYDSAWPIRTMNFRCAAFYAVVRDNVPYCFQTLPLERMRVYRVKSRD